ncbi:MAG: acetolactate synthase small subunit [Lachnospiraceae bacterium]|nr:acetolactate synthase small subunit [Lachnospiraceae bacterium]
MRKQVLSILVENTSGVLSHVSGLFSRRSYNIDSFSAGVTTDPRFTRMTIVTSGDEEILEQIEKQVAKLEDVVDIKILPPGNSVVRELMIVKVSTKNAQRADCVFSLKEMVVDSFHGKFVDHTPDSVVVEITGNTDKLDQFLENLTADGYEILELARTGLTGLTRGSDDVVMID